MAKKIKAVVKLAINAGKLHRPPDRSRARAARYQPDGLLQGYNARTSNRMGEIVPAEITIFQDGSFKFVLKSPPTSFLIKKAAGITKGASNPLTEKVGKLSKKQLAEIAETKKEDLNALDLESAMRQIAGTARQMGIEVEL